MNHTTDAAAFLRKAYQAAERLSDDPVTTNGAVLLSSTGQELSVGANRLPRSVRRSAERFERPLKYDYLVHAEVDAIAAAARLGHATEGGTLFCPWAACPGCAQLIIQAGIRRLVTHAPLMALTPERWREALDRADQMLAEAGVIVARCEVELGGLSHRFDGRFWQP